MNYFELTDDLRAGDIIREDGRKHYRFVFGSFQWERTTLFQAYLTEGTGLTGKYRPLSEEDAQKKLLERGKRLSALIKKADAIAEKAHAGQVDKAGEPYINHPRTVADSLFDWEEKIVALLHDVCEDTPWTVEQLGHAGIPPKLCQAIDLLTHPAGMSYGDYLTRLRVNRIARNVKLMDLSHNMDLDRIPNPTERDKARAAKYKRARQYLYGDIPAFDEAVTEERPEKTLLPAAEIYQRMYSQALGGRKIPHGVSNPVLRRWQDKLCLAFFVYTYSRENLKKGEIARPCAWMAADLENGELLAEIACSQTDFSDASREERYSTANPNGPATKEQFTEIYGLLDSVRRGYLAKGSVDPAAYEDYLTRMLRAVPPSYHRFYRELSRL